MIGPAIEVATGSVIAELLVELPMVSAVEVEEIVMPASEKAEPNAVAPVGGSIVLVPVPARFAIVVANLFACRVTEVFDASLELALVKFRNPLVVPVLAKTAPEVDDTSAPFQSMSAGDRAAPRPSIVITPDVEVTVVTKKLTP